MRALWLSLGTRNYLNIEMDSELSAAKPSGGVRMKADHVFAYGNTDKVKLQIWKNEPDLLISRKYTHDRTMCCRHVMYKRSLERWGILLPFLRKKCKQQQWPYIFLKSTERKLPAKQYVENENNLSIFPFKRGFGIGLDFPKRLGHTSFNWFSMSK